MNKDLQNRLVEVIQNLSATRRYRICVKKFTFYISDGFLYADLMKYNSNDVRIRKMDKATKNIECLITVVDCISTKMYYLHKDSIGEFEKFINRYSCVYEDVLTSFNNKCKLESEINSMHIYDNLYVVYALPEEMEFAVVNNHKGIPEDVFGMIDMEELDEGNYNIFDTRIGGIVASFNDLNITYLMHDHASNLKKDKTEITRMVNDIVDKYEFNKEKLESIFKISMPLYYYDKLSENKIRDNFRNMELIPFSIRHIILGDDDITVSYVDMASCMKGYSSIDEVLEKYDSMIQHVMKPEKASIPNFELPIVKNKFLNK